MKEKVNNLVTLHEAMQEKLKTASYSEQIQILTLVADKWSRMYYSEYFKVFGYLVWTSDGTKKIAKILAKPAPKKRKSYHDWSTLSGNKCLSRLQFQYVGVPKKTMLVRVKEYISKNFATCKSLCNLQELYPAFKEKHSNVNIGFSKFFAFRPKWWVLVGSKITHSACVCSAHQNVVLLVDTMDWDLTYKDLTKLTLSCLIYIH